MIRSNQRALVKRTSQIMIMDRHIKYPKGKSCVILGGASDRVNIPCIMHDISLWLIDLKRIYSKLGTI